MINKKTVTSIEFNQCVFKVHNNDYGIPTETKTYDGPLVQATVSWNDSAPQDKIFSIEPGGIEFFQMGLGILPANEVSGLAENREIVHGLKQYLRRAPLTYPQS